MSQTPPCTVTIPDFFAHCDFPLHYNEYEPQASAESEEWLLRGGNLNVKRTLAFRGLQAGQLVAMCYARAPFEQMRVTCDFINWLFHMDDISDDMTDRTTVRTAVDVLFALDQTDTEGSTSRVAKMAGDYWCRFAQTASEGTQRRFRDGIAAYFYSVRLQAQERESGSTPDVDSYVSLRRFNSGCIPCFALLEYCYDLDIPDEVMEHPDVASLTNVANDVVTWTNDVFSYNEEQARGDEHNLIVVVMKQFDVDLQTAFDRVGEMCIQGIDTFIAKRQQLRMRSWGPEIDRLVETYLDGLQDWIIGNLHWSFESERYFGKTGKDVKRTRILELMPQRL